MTNAEAWFNIALRPLKPEGSLGRTGPRTATSTLTQLLNYETTVSFVTKSFILPVCVTDGICVTIIELPDSICDRLFQLGAKHQSLLEI